MTAKRKVCAALLAVAVILGVVAPLTALADAYPAESFESQLAEFPQSYRPLLTAIHEKYPNYSFEADYVDITFANALKEQMKEHRKLVHLTADGVSWRALGPENYNWQTGTWNTYSGNWTDASREVIAYYMDPRNFITEKGIYIFARQSISSDQTIQGVKQIISGTFLERNYTPAQGEPYGGSYAEVIMAAARQSGVSPYVLAATIIIEQGVNGTSELISGASGYYNFFNYGATGNNVIQNGLNYAKSQNWNTRAASIIGGAVKYGSGYISEGQDTYYYKDFDILDSTPFNHQYAQSIYDAYASSKFLRECYIGKYDYPLSFRIPVYKDMPSVPQSMPEENGKLNNYYLTDIRGVELSPAFSMYTTEYSLSVTGDTLTVLKYPATATYEGNQAFWLKKGTNLITLPIKSETGYINTYQLTVNAASDCTFTVSAGRTLLQIDGVWYCYKDDRLDTDDVVVRYNGKYYLCRGGTVDWSFCGIYEFEGKYYYLNNGASVMGETLYRYENVWYYFKDGVVCTDTATLCPYGGNYYYVENGKANFDYTGIANYQGAQFYVQKGVLQWGVNGIVHTGGKDYYYLSNSTVNKSYNSLVNYYGTYYHVRNGKIDFTSTGIVGYYGTDYYVQNGVLKWGVNGIVHTGGKDYYYLNNSAVNKSYNSLVNYYGTYYHVRNGKIDFTSTGIVGYYGADYYVQNGVLKWGVNGIVHTGGKDYYYLNNSAVNKSYNSLVNYYGTYYHVRNGKIDFTSTGIVGYYGADYYVQNGVLKWGVNGIVHTGGKDYYYLKNSSVDKTYDSLVNYYGTWYHVKNGKIDFSSTTLVNYGGKWYYVQNGTLKWGVETLVKYYGTWYYVKNSTVDFSANRTFNYYGTNYKVVGGVVKF